jgi:M6 family metalloprotease-like protein
MHQDNNYTKLTTATIISIIIFSTAFTRISAQDRFIGIMNNVVVFVRFADQDEFTESFQFIDEFLNATDKASVKTYYSENSNNLLTIQSHFFPAPNRENDQIISYQDSHPIDYFRPYDAITNPQGYTDDGYEREDQLLADALLYVKAEIEAQNLNLDINNDGRIDNISFILQRSPGGSFSTYLYPTVIQINSPIVEIQGKTAFMGNKHTTEYLSGEDLGFFCHEMFHGFTWAPDLYNSRSIAYSPVGKWDLMGGSGTNPPAHLLVYMKMKYGTWLESIPQITQSGTYTLQCINDNPIAAYEIPSPNSEHEKFIVEYRKPGGWFEIGLDHSKIECGLIIYRVDDRYSGGGGGEPYFEVYVFRPLYGTHPEEGNSNEAGFASEYGRTSFNSTTNPSCFLNDGSDGEINISNIGSKQGNTISFDVTIPGSPTNVNTPTDNELTFYPNPVRDKLVINSKKQLKSVKIISTAGRIIFSKQFDESQIVIDMSGFKKGIYIVHLIDSNKNIEAKKVTKL